MGYNDDNWMQEQIEANEAFFTNRGAQEIIWEMFEKHPMAAIEVRRALIEDRFHGGMYHQCGTACGCLKFHIGMTVNPEYTLAIDFEQDHDPRYELAEIIGWKVDAMSIEEQYVMPIVPQDEEDVNEFDRALSEYRRMKLIAICDHFIATHNLEA